VHNKEKSAAVISAHLSGVFSTSSFVARFVNQRASFGTPLPEKKLKTKSPTLNVERFYGG